MSATDSRVYIDLHVIQTVPPSCVNRDDTGSPKTAVYGGVRRARVSSQAWKSAMRKVFQEHLDESKLGTRTKRIVEMVAEKIRRRDASVSDADAAERAERIINAAGVQTKDGEAKALFFLSDFQADNLAALALSLDIPAAAPDADAKEGKKSAKKNKVDIPADVKKTLKDALIKGHGVDIALFGRMVADDPSLNADASSQVAHAISTHRVENEFDYYTARDDRAQDDNPGADMIGTVEFNSSTLYRYATVAAHELFVQLSSDPAALAEAVREFIRAFALSMPTGKQNSFANRSIPTALMATLRVDRPVNLADAFEKPIHSSESGGYAQRSVKQLARHAESAYAAFVAAPEKTWLVGSDWDEFAGEAVTLDGLLADVEREMTARFPSEGRAS